MHPERRSLREIKARLLWWPLGSLLLVWGLLYLPHLRDSPAWYGDETLRHSLDTVSLNPIDEGPLRTSPTR